MNLKDAKDYVQRVLNISLTDVSGNKWNLKDEDVDFNLSTDKELIEYAEEQKEANEN